MTSEMKENLLRELKKLHERNELSKMVGPEYFEPGMMEYLDKSEGLFDETTGNITIRFESKGTRYEGRTEQIEKVHVGDVIQVAREKDNPYNSNNFVLLTKRGQDVGNMPAELCNAIAPLFDGGDLIFESAVVSFVEPISKRSRHAKQAMLFVELRAKIL
ncbi:HIRAN domain-containing protein [Butyrivibrio sp. LC3010]|uniref:HIRAN domain-containing protein n=1 Tax=Butyrivibrio sp. LC3010 TaxID=1280680 RepID=UPI0004256508|nr:HIRAN domain-containing protein [Butyrivibrio sp. LC3010]